MRLPCGCIRASQSRPSSREYQQCQYRNANVDTEYEHNGYRLRTSCPVGELLGESADYYKREVDYDLENLSAALEPILIIAVGAVVLILALGVFLPMWDMVAAASS